MTITRGDTVVFRITVTRTNPDTLIVSPVDLTGGKVWFTAKTNVADADASAVIRKGSPSTTLSGIVITSAVGGIATLTINPADTSALTADTTWLHYDIQVLETDGRLTTVLEGPLVVQADVTRAAS